MNSNPVGAVVAHVSPTLRRRILLLLLALGILAYELDSVANDDGVCGDSISQTTRDLFRVRTSAVGRFAFTALWGWTGAWYAAHVLRPDAIDRATN